MKPLGIENAFGELVEKDRILKMLELGFDTDEVAYMLGLIGDEYALAKEELLELKEELTVMAEPAVKPNRFAEYETGWYQDLEGNLYMYDGVVWDVVPRKEAGELEFLG